MRWVSIRKPSIAKSERDIFERFGPSVISIILFGGFSGPQETEPQKVLYGNSETRRHAEAWLTEQYDRAERRETWLITMEVAITLLVAAELFFSILSFVCGPPCGWHVFPKG
jgi:hypothetical protein